MRRRGFPALSRNFSAAPLTQTCPIFGRPGSAILGITNSVARPKSYLLRAELGGLICENSRFAGSWPSVSVPVTCERNDRAADGVTIRRHARRILARWTVRTGHRESCRGRGVARCVGAVIRNVSRLQQSQKRCLRVRSVALRNQEFPLRCRISIQCCWRTACTAVKRNCPRTVIGFVTVVGEQSVRLFARSSAQFIPPEKFSVGRPFSTDPRVSIVW